MQHRPAKYACDHRGIFQLRPDGVAHLAHGFAIEIGAVHRRYTGGLRHSPQAHILGWNADFLVHVGPMGGA